MKYAGLRAVKNQFNEDFEQKRPQNEGKQTIDKNFFIVAHTLTFYTPSVTASRATSLTREALGQHNSTMSGRAHKRQAQIFYIVALAPETKGFLGGIERSDLPPESRVIHKRCREKHLLCSVRIGQKII